jgi:hypothetical protein
LQLHSISGGSGGGSGSDVFAVLVAPVIKGVTMGCSFKRLGPQLVDEGLGLGSWHMFSAA